MKNILIFYGSYGGGHIAAAKSILEELNSIYDNINVEMIDCIEYINKFINKISTDTYKELAKKAPNLWKGVYEISKSGPIAKISTDSNILMANKLIKLIDEKQPNLIINTHPFGSQMCAYLKKEGKINIPIATILTDFHIHPQWLVFHEYIDFFFVANDEMKSDMIELAIPASRIFVTGIPVSKRFSKTFDRKKVCQSFNLDPDKDVVLFFAGGEFGLGRANTILTLKALERLFPDLQVIAISGKNKKMHDKFNNIVSRTESSSRIKIVSFTDKIPELMSISKYVITKAGGLTISESLVSNLPIIVMNPIPGQEEENAQFLVDEDVAIWVKKNDNIARVLKNLSRHPTKLNYMKSNAKRLARPNSTSDLCEILYNHLQKNCN